MRRPLVLALCLLTVSAVAAAEEDAGTAALPFLRLGIGARALALGEAYAADAAGAEAAVLNPALLASSNRYHVAFTHDEYPVDTAYEFGAFSVPLGAEAGTVALAIRYLSHGEMTRYDESGAPRGTFTAGDAAFGIAYGVRLFGGLSAGVNLNYLYSRLDDVTANGFAADVGLAYQPLERLRFGFTAANLGPEITYDEHPSPLPATLRLGAAGEVVNDPRHRVTLLADGVYPLYDEPYGCFGLQYTLYDTASLRGGYRLGHDTATFSFGAGVYFYLWESLLLSVDYAYADYGDLEVSHLFSLNLGF
jgi:opacity protein-like surface antigen